LISLIYSPFPSFRSAKVAARRLITADLAACVNITKSRSIYEWKGDLQDTSEYLLIAKTSLKRKKEAISLLNKTHPYELPCILSWNVSATPEFEKWVNENTSRKIY